MLLRFLPLGSLCLLGVSAASLAAAPPSITSIFPAGAKRGASTEITVAGATDKATRIWVSGRGVSIEPAKSKGKFKVKIAADAVPGTYRIRPYNAEGAGALMPFLVGMLPEAAEKEPNNEPKTAQSLDGPIVVNGRLAKTGDVDCFAISAKKGQTIVAAVAANHAFNSPMDSVLQVVSADGFVVAQNHDFHGLDPLIAFPVPKDGVYTVRLFAFPAQPNSTIRFAGGDAYIYRLTVTTSGYLDYTIPLSAAPSDKTLEARGWNIPPEARSLPVPKPVDPGAASTTIFHPKLAGVFSLHLAPHGASPASTHILARPGSAIRVPFQAKKKERFAIEVRSRSLGLPVDGVIRVLDAANKQLASAVPPRLHMNTVLAFTAPSDGAYTIEVTDLYGAGGPRHAFVLLAGHPEPDATLTVAADLFTVAPGGSLDIPVKIARKNGFSKPLEIAIEGLPAGVKWSLKPPAGKKKADPNLATLTISSPKAGLGGAFRIVGRVKGDAGFLRFAQAPQPAPNEPVADLWLSTSSVPVKKTPGKKKK